MESGRVKALPSSTRSHTELLRREHAVIKELMNGLSWTIKHIDGATNPSDRLTRHSLLDYIINNFEREENCDDDSDTFPTPPDPYGYFKNLTLAPQSQLTPPGPSKDAVMMVRPMVSEINKEAIDMLKEQTSAVTLQDIKLAQGQAHNLPNTKDFIWQNGLLHYRRAQGLSVIYIPLSLRPKLLKLFHDELY
ncbi:hypothetical protein FOL47_004788, partial [Perkinsus chesapeaki]